MSIPEPCAEDFRLLPYGDRALLIELPPAGVPALRAALLALSRPDWVSVVPAARTVLVEFDPTMTSLAEVSAIVRACDLGAPTHSTAAPVVIEVEYDGPDLDSVATLSGLSPAEVVRAHTDAQYTVQFCGFSPGFGYLTGLDPRLVLPRLDSPRPAVPAGSVAVAAEYTGVYPRRSPGGWRLIGRTEAVLFDLSRTPPALFAPGTTVRFSSM